jgi:hypothetical protein
MNQPCFVRFTQAHYLQRIGRDRVTQILTPFAAELLAHGLALPARRLPDDLFYNLLTTLPRFQGELSAGLLEAMTAIEVIEEVYPDEGPGAAHPLVVTELRLRLAERARPVLLAAGPAGQAPDAMLATPIEGSSAGTANLQHLTLNIEPGPVREVLADYHRSRPAKSVARYKFTRKGSVYVVRYDGMPKFHMPAIDGPKYIDYVLHRENESFRVMELERTVKPEKAAARTVNSIQRALDPQALRELRSELLELEAELAEAESAGLAAEADRLEAQRAQIKKCLIANAQLDGDSGERARNNVRKAIGRAIARLRKGGPAEQAFARHLTESLSLGYEVMYVQPLGKIWE